MLNEDCTVAFLPKDILKGAKSYALDRESMPIGNNDAAFLRRLKQAGVDDVRPPAMRADGSASA